MSEPQDLLITMSALLSNSVAKSTITLEESISQMKLSGMDVNQIKSVLMNDLNNGGRIFGSYRNAIKMTTKNGVGYNSNIASQKVYQDSSVEEFQWVGISDNKVCEDCEDRHGQTGTMEYFRTVGLPRSGFSICQTNCRCQLVPMDYKGENIKEPMVLKSKKPDSVTSLKMGGNFKNSKDALKWMSNNGVINNGFKKMPLDYANAITEAISRLPKRVRQNIVLGNFSHFQKAKGSKFRTASGHNYGVSQQLDGFDAVYSKIDSIKPSFKDMKNANLPFTDPNYKPLPNYQLISFNTRKYKSLDDITKRKEKMNINYSKSNGINYNFNMTGEATVHHEFGHLVQEYLSPDKRNEWNKLAKEWIKIEPTQYIKTKQSFTEFYSEAWAEAWASYQTNQKSRLPDYIIKFIEEIK